MNSKEKKFLENLINKYSKKQLSKNILYPLIDDAFSTNDILKGMEVMLSGKITMLEITQQFEHEFAKHIGSKYAVMVNSGSSANLLAAFALVNPRKKNFLKRDSEFLIPVLCWSTSLWPFVQAGLKPKFVDVDVNNFNMDMHEFEKKLTSKVKAIVAVHVLGNSTQIEEVGKIAKSRNIFLVEDTCESLGAKYKKRYLGTFGDFGTYSFFYSHQITSGEGGMIVCNSKEDYDLIYSMRSHGWSRKLNRGNKKKNANFNIVNDTSFNFINSGFNLRPLDLSAAIGLSQFRRLNSLVQNRSINRKKIISQLTHSPLWNQQFSFLEITKNIKPSPFGMPILINKKHLSKKEQFFNFLKKQGIETRIVIGGNFVNHPSIKIYNLNSKNENFPKAQEIEDRGFYIGLHPKPISNKILKHLEENLLIIDKL
ncbi:MAG: pyridoxamine 5-phosphate-dependent dehydrase [Parcubacteria group bacterium]|jgi:CDP-6-deoxy-D-xylo-4-hexulose-3-dehydrase|nr:pyridoxamine 5-phosphate-dependent dehydrase [Parcubacteria group bacterium]